MNVFKQARVPFKNPFLYRKYNQRIYGKETRIRVKNVLIDLFSEAGWQRSNPHPKEDFSERTCCL
jgi:hypothetical protein